MEQTKNNIGVLVVEEVTTPCTGLSAARTRDLVHYEVNFPALPSLLSLKYRE